MLTRNKLSVILLGLVFLFSACASTQTVSDGTAGDETVPVDARVTNKFTQDEGGDLSYYVVLYYFAEPSVSDSDKNTNGENQSLGEVLEDIGEGIKNTGKELGRTDDLTSTQVKVDKKMYDKMKIGSDVAISYSTSNKKNVSFR